MQLIIKKPMREKMVESDNLTSIIYNLSQIMNPIKMWKSSYMCECTVSHVLFFATP